MDRELHILILEDDPVDAELAAAELKKSGLLFTSKVVDTREAFLEELEEFYPDIILSCYDLSSFKSLEPLEIVKGKVPDVPFILVTGKIGEEFAIETLKQGVTDYVLKSNLKRLAPSVRRALEEARLISERKQAEEAFRKEHVFLKSILNTAQAIILVLDINGNIVSINPYMEQISGYRLDEVKGKDWFSIFLPKEKQESVRALFKKAIGDIKTKGNIDSIITRDGPELYIEWYDTTLRGEDGNVAGLLSIGQDITEHKQAEEKINEQLEFLKTLLDTIPNPVFYKNVEGKYLGCNKAFELFTGRKKEALIGKTVHDLGPKEIADKYFEQDNELFQNPGLQTYEWKVRDEEGILRDVIFNKATFNDIKGETTGLIGVISDITERKRAEERIRLNEDRLKSLYALSQMRPATEKEIIDFALEQAVRLTNSKIGYLHFVHEDQINLELFTWSREVLKECTAVKSGVYPIEKAGVWVDCIRTGKPVIHNDYQNLPDKRGYPEGHIHLIRHMSVPVFDGDRIVAIAGVGNKEEGLYDDSDVRQLELFMGEMWNILKQKRIEESIRESEAYLNAIKENMQAGLVIIDAENHRIIDANKAAVDLIGVPKEEIFGKECHEYICPAERGKCPVTDLHQVIDKSERVLINAKGEHIPILKTVVTLKIRNRRYVIDSFIDITERKKLEAQLLLAQKMEAIGELAGGMAHDFNNLLQSIIMGIAIAQTRSHEDKVRELLMQTADQCVKAEELSNLLITFSKGGSPLVEKISITNMLKETVLLVLKGSAVDTELAIPDDLFPLEIDERQIRIAINQLVMNSKEAMPSGGLLKVQARNLESIAKENVSLPEGKYVKITFADNGAGISPENLSKIFDPYYTTKEMGSRKGMGLGLTVCQSIIKKHTGIITAESKAGTGTAFHMYLPAAKDQ
jgi:PAS domain S-box-containing protein